MRDSSRFYRELTQLALGIDVRRHRDNLFDSLQPVFRAIRCGYLEFSDGICDEDAVDAIAGVSERAVTSIREVTLWRLPAAEPLIVSKGAFGREYFEVWNCNLVSRNSLHDVSRVLGRERSVRVDRLVHAHLMHPYSEVLFGSGVPRYVHHNLKMLFRLAVGALVIEHYGLANRAASAIAVLGDGLPICQPAGEPGCWLLATQ